LDKLNFIHVGTFSSPVGIKGEVSVNFLTTSFKVFKNLNNYLSENFKDLYFFKSMRLVNKKLVVHPNNCFTRDDAYKFKGKKIFSKSTNFPKINKNQYYYKDLIGCTVNLIDGKKIGTVINVNDFGAGDLIEVAINTKKIYIPLNKENLVSVDIDNKKIIVNPIRGILN
tara:strand:- start:800 stop:1306 length:507 start_codon:yes stop_codon:yes gene_type:complete